MAGDLTFVSTGQGTYTASLSGLGLSMGTHQCASLVQPHMFCGFVGRNLLSCTPPPQSLILAMCHRLQGVCGGSRGKWQSGI